MERGAQNGKKRLRGPGTRERGKYARGTFQLTRRKVEKKRRLGKYVIRKKKKNWEIGMKGLKTGPI